MRRVAVHYIFRKQLYWMHYVKLEQEHLKNIAPLQEEMAHTEFYPGWVIVVPDGVAFSVVAWKTWMADHPGKTTGDWLACVGITDTVSIGDRVELYHLDPLTQTAAKLRTDDCCCYSHV